MLDLPLSLAVNASMFTLMLQSHIAKTHHIPISWYQITHDTYELTGYITQKQQKDEQRI